MARQWSPFLWQVVVTLPVAGYWSPFLWQGSVTPSCDRVVVTPSCGRVVVTPSYGRVRSPFLWQGSGHPSMESLKGCCFLQVVKVFLPRNANLLCLLEHTFFCLASSVTKGNKKYRFNLRMLTSICIAHPSAQLYVSSNATVSSSIK